MLKALNWIVLMEEWCIIKSATQTSRERPNSNQQKKTQLEHVGGTGKDILCHEPFSLSTFKL